MRHSLQKVGLQLGDAEETAKALLRAMHTGAIPASHAGTLAATAAGSVIASSTRRTPRVSTVRGSRHKTRKGSSVGEAEKVAGAAAGEEETAGDLSGRGGVVPISA